MRFFRIATQLAFFGVCVLCGVVAGGADYVVVVSQATQNDPEWSKVVEQPGRYTFVEAFFANQHALIDRLETYFPDIARIDAPPGTSPRAKFDLSEEAKKAGLSVQDGIGLLHDRDVVAVYGDPAWNAKMAPGTTYHGMQRRSPNPA